jgi:hypothetical protein
MFATEGNQRPVYFSRKSRYTPFAKRREVEWMHVMLCHKLGFMYRDALAPTDHSSSINSFETNRHVTDSASKQTNKQTNRKMKAHHKRISKILLCDFVLMIHSSKVLLFRLDGLEVIELLYNHVMIFFDLPTYVREVVTGVL